MELDKLLESWNEEEHNFSHKEPTEIVDMLSKKSRSSMARIRRNMMFEFLFGIVAISMTIILNTYLVEDRVYQGFNFIFLTAFGCLNIVYVYKFRGLYKQLGLTTNIEKTLLDSTRKIETAMEMYKSINYSVMPFALIIGMMVGGTRSFVEKMQDWPVYAVITVVTFVAMMFFVEYSVNKMYGKHLAQLKENYNNLKNI